MRKILIVDDEPDMRLAIKNVLKLRGYDVIEAGDGPGALDIISKTGVDLMLLDIRLPGMDGIEVLEKARKLNKKLPIVMITGYGHIRSAVDVMKLGANEYLQKPFENTRLVETVRRFVEDKKEDSFSGKANDKKTAEKRTALSKFSFFIAGAILIGLAVFAFREYLPYQKTYSLKSQNISAITWNNNDLFAADWLEEKVYLYHLSAGQLNFKTAYNLKGVHISAITAAGDYVYISDSWAKNVQKRNIKRNFKLVKKYNVKKEIISVFYDGTYLWALDADGNLTLRKTDNNLTIVSSFKMKRHPDQIFKDNKNLWSAVSAEKKFFRHKLDDNLTIGKTYAVKNLPDDYSLSAAAWRKGRLWFSIGGENKIYEVGKNSLIRIQ